MEDVKQETVIGVCGHGACTCGHSCMNMHRFCHSRFCLLRILIVIVVLGGVFATGYCVGAEGREGDGEGYGEGQKDGHMMMRYQNDSYGYGDQSENSESNNSDYGDAPENVPNINVIYRTMGQRVPVQAVTTATGTPVK